MTKRITAPLTKEEASTLHSGDNVLITGTIYTARDAAHKRLCELLDAGKELPFDIQNSVIYFVGPTPAKEGQAVGSAGPTTSYRMDAYSPRMLKAGSTGMIGKGKRSPEVIEAMKQTGAVYFGAIGGAGAYLSRCIRKAEIVCYEDLGAEAVRKLTVVDFPAFVIIDSEGNNLYETGREAYLKENTHG